MYVVSPWSRGGWVNSQVFDHTSVIRFLEARFGFHCPNISAWRRTVCGDLLSAFDFAHPHRSPWPSLPDTSDMARRSAAIPRQIDPEAPAQAALPVQEPGLRRSRPLPYWLEVNEVFGGSEGAFRLRFTAEGAGCVFHVYDRNALTRTPRRYTVAAGHAIEGEWLIEKKSGYDLWVIGPNGFHRHFQGQHTNAPAVCWRLSGDALIVDVSGRELEAIRERPNADPIQEVLRPGSHRWSLAASSGWYDLTLRSKTEPDFLRRVAGRHDRAGRMTTSDPFI